MTTRSTPEYVPAPPNNGLLLLSQGMTVEIKTLVDQGVPLETAIQSVTLTSVSRFISAYTAAIVARAKEINNQHKEDKQS